jgi:catechol 2,3-dioxygenase-like lactoylglutathione lyase family enzyme
VATEGWKARSIFHFVLPCADADRSIEFYGLFGFEIIKDNRGVVWPDYVGENFNMKSAAQGNAVQLILPHDDELQTRVDLIEWLDPRWKSPYAGLPAEQNFPRVMALLTENVIVAVDDLASKGLRPTNPLRPPDAKIGVQGVVCFADPDGHIVELIEYFPGQLGSRTDDLEHRDS